MAGDPSADGPMFLDANKQEPPGSEDDWSVVSLQQRMVHMESALSEVITHWQLAAAEPDKRSSSRPSGAVMPEPPEIVLHVQQENMRHQLKRPVKSLEVFCHHRSQLTAQVANLWYSAKRFSRAHGDLMTQEGLILFRLLNLHEPEHAWFSPQCGLSSTCAGQVVFSAKPIRKCMSVITTSKSLFHTTYMA